MRVRTLLLLGLATLLVAVPAALAGSSHRAANSTSYPDSTGEDANAPDITSVNVSNDDAGLITFQVLISNRPAFTDDMFLLIFMDTDQNASTGDPDIARRRLRDPDDPGCGRPLPVADLGERLRPRAVAGVADLLVRGDRRDTPDQRR